MKRRTMKRFVCTIFCGLLLTACAGTQLSRTQVDEARRGKPVSNVLVIAVTYKKDIRRAYENSFVAQLRGVGVKAVSSADAIPISEEQQLEKEAISKAVQAHGNDAVIITHVADVERKEVISRELPSRHGYYNHYQWAYNSIFGPGYSGTRTVVRLVTNLYDVKTERLIWSGRSETLNPDSTARIIDDVIGAVVKDLQKNRLLPG